MSLLKKKNTLLMLSFFPCLNRLLSLCSELKGHHCIITLTGPVCFWGAHISNTQSVTQWTLHCRQTLSSPAVHCPDWEKRGLPQRSLLQTEKQSFLTTRSSFLSFWRKGLKTDIEFLRDASSRALHTTSLKSLPPKKVNYDRHVHDVSTSVTPLAPTSSS